MWPPELSTPIQLAKFSTKLINFTSSSEDEKENASQLIILEEEEQKENDALARNTEDGAPKRSKS